MQLHIFSLSQKGILAYITKKLRFAKKKGVFYWASKSTILVEKGVFGRPKSAKRGCVSNLGTSVVYALVGSGGPGWHFMNKFYW